MEIVIEHINASIASASQTSPVEAEDAPDTSEELGESQATPTPADDVSRRILRQQMENVLGSLSGLEKDVLNMRFGLNDGHPRTLEEVGKHFGLTRERIRQIEAKALRKLRRSDRKRRSNLLTVLEKEVLVMRLGLREEPLRIPEDIGRQLGMAADEVRRIEADALRKLGLARLPRRDDEGGEPGSDAQRVPLRPKP
jgi:DNA-directed RNA polymerase sigma subunit (sigma70/sigma32)